MQKTQSKKGGKDAEEVGDYMNRQWRKGSIRTAAIRLAWRQKPSAKSL